MPRTTARRSVTTLLLCAVLIAAPTADCEERVLDLSHPFDSQTIYWPTEPGFTLDRGDAGITERGYFYAANRFASPEHGGTHIDAPYHFAAEGQTVDQIPVDRLMGEGACVDVTQQCAGDPDYLVTTEDLVAWEEEHSESLAGKIVLLRTGYAEHWPQRKKYLGTDLTGREAVEQLHFPGLHPSAAVWLATRREVKAVGIDTASIDHGPSRDFQSHVQLFARGVPALENVGSMAKLPAVGFRVIALPMKIAGGTGAPCRIVVELED